MAVANTVAERRLGNQKLSRTALRRPEDVVTWLGAVQAQDYPGAKWGVAQRALGLTEVAIDRAFDEGRFLRTHILRPTWHFVPANDIRWMLSLSAPRVHSSSASSYRRLELDGRTLARSHAVFERALRGGVDLTRAELASALRRARIECEGQRLAYVVMHAELEQVITSGPRRGKQFTYMLVDDRAPGAVRMPADAALAELTRRYFTSHGPATVRDYSWWSGLTMGQAREGLALLGSSVEQETIAGLTYWLVPSRASGTATPSSIYLLPNYDEYPDCVPRSRQYEAAAHHGQREPRLRHLRAHPRGRRRVRRNVAPREGRQRRARLRRVEPRVDAASRARPARRREAVRRVPRQGRYVRMWRSEVMMTWSGWSVSGCCSVRL